MQMGRSYSLLELDTKVLWSCREDMAGLLLTLLISEAQLEMLAAVPVIALPGWGPIRVQDATGYLRKAGGFI